MSTTGIRRVVRPAFKRRHSSKPPIAGITTSLRIRSGISRAIAASASAPSHA
jgi:hypothetical protein